MKTINMIHDEVFLTEAEWTVLCRYIPVRYLRARKDIMCCKCGGSDNLQLCHLIPFTDGIRKFALRPEFLNSPVNVVTGCKKCNDSIELSEVGVFCKLSSMGIEEIPSFVK